MNCCQCQGIEELFNDQVAEKELLHFRTKGPNRTTNMLIDAIKAEDIRGLTLLDVGGGVGAVQEELLGAGCRTATDIDASEAFLRVAKEEAQRQGLVDRVSYQHGNFVDLAAQIPDADIVTLDRVICCYPDMENMVRLSAMHAKKLYGVVFPRDTWWIKIGFLIMNFIFKLQRTQFRIFPHSTRAVEALVSRAGLKRRFYHRTLVWQVIVYSH